MQARQAGPGPDQRRWEGQGAAGPASPRLIVEEVSVLLSPQGTEARVALALGPQRYVGSSVRPAARARPSSVSAQSAFAAAICTPTATPRSAIAAMVTLPSGQAAAVSASEEVVLHDQLILASYRFMWLVAR